MLTDAHPALDDLLVDPVVGDLAQHLAGCARCRIDRRMALETLGAEPDTIPGLHAARARLSEARREATLSMTLSLGPQSERDPDLLIPGADIGGHRIEAWVGRGGMASVFRVRDTRDDAVYALKVMNRAGAEARIDRERLAQRTVSHANVVSVRGSLEVQGVPALLLDYVPGPTLHEWLREHGPPPLDVADTLAEGILKGLFAVHTSGFVHRDLKPRNILLHPDVDAPGGVIPRIADFGLVRPVEADRDGRLTRSGLALGTPGYMAPEQIRDAHRATERSDVFSVGAVLYELLSGVRAFQGGTLMDQLEQILSRQAEPLPDQVPPRMRQTVHRALSPDPADRPADAAAVLLAWRGLSR